jgi:hypothetical protein
MSSITTDHLDTMPDTPNSIDNKYEDPSFSEGDAVTWTWDGEPVHGRVADVRDQHTPPDASEPITGGDEATPVYVIDEWDDTVGAFRRENVAKPEGSLDESQRDMPPRSDEHYAAATILREATPVRDSRYTATTLDLVTLATDELVRAATGRAVVWASPDGALAYKATIPDKYIAETDLTEADFVPTEGVAAAARDAIDHVDEHGAPNPDSQQEGLARMHQLVDHHEADEPLAVAYWEEMEAFHKRHRAQDNHVDDSEEGKPALSDPGVFSDHTWGSDAGYEQAQRIAAAVREVDGDRETEAESGATTEAKAIPDDFGVDVYRVTGDASDNGPLGVAVDMPESDVYVDWRREAFEDPLADPHVSVYGSIEDLEQATGNETELVSGRDATTEAKGDPMANGHDLDPATGEGTCASTGNTIEAETWGDLRDDCPHCGDPLSMLGEQEVTPETSSTAGGGLSMKGPAGTLAAPPGSTADITEADTNKIDVEALPDAHQAAVTADDFYVYGKASIEQWDDDDVPTKIQMDALEGALERFFGSELAPGIISRYHQDIPVGQPVREHTLDEPATIRLATPDGEPEVHEFEAGETLETHVEDADGDGAPELWLLSNLAGDSEPAKRARLLALQGDLNGYSVTIHRNDDEMTDDGRVVTECDLHAVTLGTDDEIKNAGSTFDVAEFKATLRRRAGLDDGVIGALTDAVRSALR